MKESKSTEGEKTRQLGIRFFSNAYLYGLGTALIRAGTLILLPVYWRVLTPDDFGLIALSQIVIQLLSTLLDLGISGSIQRHYFEWSSQERPRHLAAVWSFSLGFSTVLCVILTLLAPSVQILFDAEMSLDLVYFGIWIAYFQNFGLLPFSLCRIREQLPLFSMMSIGQFVIQSACILIFIFGFHLGYKGYLWGMLSGSVFYSLVSLIFIVKEVKFPFAWMHLKEPLSYALPTAPAAILEGTGSIMDRFFLQKFVGLDQLGIYSLGRQFGQAYNFFLSTLKNSWVPLTFRLVSERKDAANVLGRLSTYYLIVLMVPALAIAMLAPDLIIWIDNPKYFGIGPLVPYFVGAFAMAGIGHIYGRGLDLAKKMQYYWIVYASHFIANLGLLWLWAPNYGIWGAIAALLVAGGIREIVLIGFANYFYPRPVEYKSILIIVVMNALCFAGGLLVPPMAPIASMLIKSGLVFTFTFLILAILFKGRATKIFKDFLRKRLPDEKSNL